MWNNGKSHCEIVGMVGRTREFVVVYFKQLKLVTLILYHRGQKAYRI